MATFVIIVGSPARRGLSANFEKSVLPQLARQAWLDLAARRLGNGSGADQHDRVDGDLVIVEDSLADVSGYILDRNPLCGRALHLLDQDQPLIAVLVHRGEGGTAMPA